MLNLILKQIQGEQAYVVRGKGEGGGKGYYNFLDTEPLEVANKTKNAGADHSEKTHLAYGGARR